MASRAAGKEWCVCMVLVRGLRLVRLLCRPMGAATRFTRTYIVHTTPPLLCLHTGAKISKGVIQDICTKFSKCQCVQSLALNLYEKKLISEEEFHHLQLPRATGQELTAILIKASQEGMGRGERLVRDLYLALLDMFAENCNDWCHRIALRVLREAGNLNIYDICSSSGQLYLTQL